MTMNSSSDIQSTLASSLELIEKCFAENEEKQYKIKDCLRLLENKRLISKKSIEETFRRIIGLQDDLMRDLNEAIENKAETLRLLLRKLESINGAVKEKREHINNLMKGKIVKK
ncbi:uncharacterized protein LOC135928571 [Gordionus sp. m RMFG-2023]|uniref:uncharacterized protein LOC135928571 n=1 Tax=Gordionus sp. m RMFG-2023 TaxID=3053472 RepID=UPI0031FE2258